jgi:hypothetical protein
MAVGLLSAGRMGEPKYLHKHGNRTLQTPAA